MIYICCCFRSRWWWFYSSHSPPCCDEFFLLLFTERLKISPNKISLFLLFFLLTHSLFGDYDDSVLFTRAYFRFDETPFREAQNHSSWDRMDAMECKARRRSFFMKGSESLRFLLLRIVLPDVKIQRQKLFSSFGL